MIHTKEKLLQSDPFDYPYVHVIITLIFKEVQQLNLHTISYKSVQPQVKFYLNQRDVIYVKSGATQRMNTLGRSGLWKEYTSD